jgi:hypothetical protein
MKHYFSVIGGVLLLILIALIAFTGGSVVAADVTTLEPVYINSDRTIDQSKLPSCIPVVNEQGTLKREANGKLKCAQDVMGFPPLTPSQALEKIRQGDDGVEERVIGHDGTEHVKLKPVSP